MHNHKLCDFISTILRLVLSLSLCSQVELQWTMLSNFRILLGRLAMLAWPWQNVKLNIMSIYYVINLA